MLGKFIVFWFILGGLITLWDAGFVFARPESFEGGKFAQIWIPYQTYIKHDKRYADMNDTFVILQSILNVIEVALQFLAVAYSLFGSRKALYVAIIVSAMTLWKTVIFLAMDLDGTYTGHNSWQDFLLIFIIPASFWITLPSYVIYACFNKISSLIDNTASKKKN